MAGYYNKSKDYSLAIKQAQNRGASASELRQLRQERQNKIDAQYGGRDPYRGSSHIMGDSPITRREHDNHTLHSGGTLYHQGRPSVHLGSVWQPNRDYAAEAGRYAQQGDWDAVDDVLKRRQAKIDAQGGNDRGLTNRELWDSLRADHGFSVNPGGGLRPSGSGGGPVHRPQPRPGYGGGGYDDGGYGGYDGGFQDPSAYLQQLYQQKQAEAEARLRAQYQQDAAAIRAHYESMDNIYEELRNRQAAQNDMEKLRMNELGAAQGLNTGTFGQLALGQSGAYQDAFAAIGRQEAAEKAQEDWKLKQLESAYRDAVEESRASGQADLMDKLYREFVRQMEAQERQRREELDRQDREDRYQQQLAGEQQKQALERAKTLAAHGDFSGYAALGYSQEEIAAMEAEWKRTHLKT